ncbi:MAG: S41 family peptidase [Fuerstiella sp.]
MQRHTGNVRFSSSAIAILLATFLLSCFMKPVSAQSPASVQSIVSPADTVNTILRGTPDDAQGIDEVVRALQNDLWSEADALRVGEAYEQTRQWVNAIKLYEAAIERFPKDSGLTYALRRTRVHFAIDRRYADRSFEEQMLLTGRSEALDLMEDVMTRVQLEYVDSVSATKFIAHGTESLYMALGNERFLKKNVRGDQTAATDRVRATLIKEYWNRPVMSRLEARMIVTEVCDLARKQLNLSGTAVVMEYLFGGCNALDDYSNFLTPDRYNDLFGSIQGEFVGIGIEMEGEKGRGMHLVNVLLDSPAEDGGLRPGDYIVEVDGRDCRDLSTDDTARLLRGPKGSRVELKFESPEGKISQTVLTRRPVQVRSVTRALLLDENQGIGYIRMTGFQNSTAEELDAALKDLERQGMRSLIWDLRGNPGGLLDTAAAVIDRFIGDGVLVSTEGRSFDQNQTFRAHSFNTRTIPLVLLVDENSASASEIVAGAVNDHKRGQIVGRKTYGKWSVQSIIHLPGGTGLKLTTAKFYSPHHQNYAGKGIAPHVNVPLPENVRRTFFRGRTSDEIRIDPDVARALELLERRYTRN